MSSSIDAPNNTITNRDGLLLAYNTINAPGGHIIIGSEPFCASEAGYSCPKRTHC
jgi:hypothetical protein